MSEEYVLIVVNNGDNRGETLVRIWPSGQVEADYRGDGERIWQPVSLLGGGMRFEGAVGNLRAAYDGEFHAELVDPPPPFDQDAEPQLVVVDSGPLVEVLGRSFDRAERQRVHRAAQARADADEEGGALLRTVALCTLLLATAFLVAVLFPTGIGS